jgi:hypothetical protein
MTVDPSAGPAAVAASFLDALGTRDFARLRSCLSHDARMRALLPSGPREWQGAPAVADRFRTWFGDAAELRLLDSAVGRIGSLLHLRWRLRLWTEPDAALVVEQHAYVDAADRIHRLDLLCSGFHGDGS